MEVIRYRPEQKNAWNDCVRKSCNGTFLFDRNFMDYHKDRYQDVSLMFYHKNKLKGIFPANIIGKEVFSHGGLTYGGLIWDKTASSLEVATMLELAFNYYSNSLNANSLYYKHIPSIYHTYPAEQDLYFIYRRGAEMIHRKLSSSIYLTNALPFSTLRRRCLSKANKAGLAICQDEDISHWEQFWVILTDVLARKHGEVPVHSIQEMLHLKSNFSNRIRLLTVEKCYNVIAGTVLFITENVVHAQYISSNDYGCTVGALDFLFSYILDSDICQKRNYFDFGVSTEDEGAKLNKGLLFQKEGFGGRGICYDEYIIKL